MYKTVIIMGYWVTFYFNPTGQLSVIVGQQATDEEIEFNKGRDFDPKFLPIERPKR